MKDIKFISTFRGLIITEKIRGHIEIIPGINITNDPTIRHELITAQTKKAIGTIEYDFLFRTSNIVFGYFNKQDLQGMDGEKFLLVLLLWIKDLFKNSWLIKDNTFECDAAFISLKQGSIKTDWSRNHLAITPTLADGLRGVNIEFTIDELKRWSILHNKVESYLHNRESLSIRFMMDKGFSRIGRALLFINAARNSSNLAFKVSNYCSAFETLFSTDNTEISHKLSERVAFFLEHKNYRKLESFSNIKKAYTVRSKLTHGDNISIKQAEELPIISKFCDDYLRVILNRIIEDKDLITLFDSTNENIDVYFNKLIFEHG